MPDYKTTYPPQPTPEHLRPNDLYIREYAQGVWIPLLQNFFGGLLGAGGFVGIGAWKAGMIPEDAAILGATIGGLIFCAVTAFRAFRDEARTIIAAYGERQDKATRSALQAELDQLRREVKELRSQGIITSKMNALMATERLLGDYYERHLPCAGHVPRVQPRAVGCGDGAAQGRASGQREGRRVGADVRGGVGAHPAYAVGRHGIVRRY
jgi:hypothetical protein